MTLAADTGEPVALLVSETREGRVYVFNTKTNVLCAISAAHAALMLPDAAMFTDTERANPWESWLR